MKKIVQRWRRARNLFVRHYIETRLQPRRQPLPGGYKKWPRNSYCYVRFTKEEFEIVQGRAAEVGWPMTPWVRAAALGARYRGRLDPKSHKQIYDLNLELTTYGRALLEIKSKLGQQDSAPLDVIETINSATRPLIDVMRQLKNLMAKNEVLP